MNNITTDPRSTSPDNFERLYSELTDSDRALINAYMSMTFAMLRSIQQIKESEKGA